MLTKAESLGIDLIPIQENYKYRLIKTGQKNNSPYGYPESYVVMEEGYLDYNEKFNCFSIRNYNGLFVTSSIVKFDIETLEFETLNSYYRLEVLPNE